MSLRDYVNVRLVFILLLVLMTGLYLAQYDVAWTRPAFLHLFGQDSLADKDNSSLDDIRVNADVKSALGMLGNCSYNFSSSYEGFYADIRRFIQKNHTFPWHLISKGELYSGTGLLEYITQYAVKGVRDI